MTVGRYAKLAGSFWRHTKATELSSGAGWLWTRALSFVVDQMTDGVITAAQGRMLSKRFAREAAELVAAGLWVTDGDTWSFHDFGAYSMTKAQWAEAREKGAAKVARHRASKAPVTTQVTERVTGYIPLAVTGLPLDPGPRTQDITKSDGEAPPPGLHLSDLIRQRWAKTYQDARGQMPAGNDAMTRKLSMLLGENAALMNEAPAVLLERVLAGYWSDPWTRNHANRASLLNLLEHFDTLIAAKPKAATIPDSAYDPATMTPTTPAQSKAQAAWIADGCPSTKRRAS